MKNTNEEKLKYGEYCRKSSDREDKQVLSISSQKRGLANIAEQNNLYIKKKIQRKKVRIKLADLILIK